jgi:hypothetical protein
LTVTSTRKKRRRKPQKITQKKREKKISKTHLTASGVCTTIRPEKSGM